MLLITIHELGHFLAALFFNWKIDKIYIYPLGGITKFNDKVNKPFKEELLILLMGPLFQIIGSCLLYKIDNNAYIYSNYLFMFNFLPIVPLDGGRLLTLLFSLVIPYKKTLNLLINISFISYIIIFSYIWFKLSLSILIIFFFLIFKIIDERKNIKYLFNKYLFERYLYNFNYKKRKLITNANNMYKYKKHIFKYNNRLYNEKEYLIVKR